MTAVYSDFYVGVVEKIEIWLIKLIYKAVYFIAVYQKKCYLDMTCETPS